MVQIVTKDSATVGGYEAQAIPADHAGMARFDSRSEPGYINIKSVLQRWVDALQKTGNAVPASVSFFNCRRIISLDLIKILGNKRPPRDRNDDGRHGCGCYTWVPEYDVEHIRHR